MTDQPAKPSLLEVMIHGKRFFDAEFLHHDETGTVRCSPVLVGSTAEEVPSRGRLFRAREDGLYKRRTTQSIIEFNGQRTLTDACESIAQFKQDERRSHQGSLLLDQIAPDSHRAIMPLIVFVRHRDQARSIQEHRFHSLRRPKR